MSRGEGDARGGETPCRASAASFPQLSEQAGSVETIVTRGRPSRDDRAKQNWRVTKAF